MANSVNPDQVLHSVASNLGLHCLQRPICAPILRVNTVIMVASDKRGIQLNSFLFISPKYWLEVPWQGTFNEYTQHVVAGLSGSVGCASDWWSGGCGFDLCRVGNILSWRFDHEIFSTVILSLLLIQEGQLSVSGKRMCTLLVNCF